MERKRITIDSRYLISEDGYVYSTRTKNTKVISTQRDQSGNYKRVCLGKKHYLVHRLVAMAFIPNPDDLPQVNHIDGDKLNNHVSNLEWVTAGENQIHAYNTGLKTKPKGLLNGRQELTEAEVLEIYNRLLKSEHINHLATEFKVTPTQISRIKKKEAWSHLTGHLPDMSIRNKTKPLTKGQILIIKDLISEGNTFKETKLLLDFSISQDQFYRIKSL